MVWSVLFFFISESRGTCVFATSTVCTPDREMACLNKWVWMHVSCNASYYLLTCKVGVTCSLLVFRLVAEQYKAERTSGGFQASVPRLSTRRVQNAHSRYWWESARVLKVDVAVESSALTILHHLSHRMHLLHAHGHHNRRKSGNLHEHSLHCFLHTCSSLKRFKGI